MLNKQVALELGTNKKTIKVLRARVTENMGAESLPVLLRLPKKWTFVAWSIQLPHWTSTVRRKSSPNDMWPECGILSHTQWMTIAAELY